MKQDIYIRVADGQLGPMSFSELKSGIKSGRISSQDFIWHRYHRRWVRLSDTDRFRPLFASAHKVRVMVVGGGKGGVGKTALTAALARELAGNGKRVIAVDADFEGPNLHEWLGVPRPEVTLIDYFKCPGLGLNEIVDRTSIANVRMIANKVTQLKYANPLYSQKMKFIRDLQDLDADFVVIDLGPGVKQINIDLFLAADESILVTTPEPLTILDTYKFTKVALIRQLQKVVRDREADEHWQQETRNFIRDEDYTLHKLLANLRGWDEKILSLLKRSVKSLNPKIIVNMIYEASEIMEGWMLARLLMEKLNIRSEYMGYIYYNRDLRNATKEEKLRFLMERGSSEVLALADPPQQSIGSKIRDAFFSQPEVARAFLCKRRIVSRVRKQTAGVPVDAEKQLAARSLKIPERIVKEAGR